MDGGSRELLLLRTYAVLATALLGVLTLAAFRQPSQRARFGEIDVERINIIEPDGTLRLTLSDDQAYLNLAQTPSSGFPTPSPAGSPVRCVPAGSARGCSSSTIRATRTAV